MTTQKIIITATSGSYYGGNKAQISVDNQEIGFGNYSRGINVAVFDETTSLPLFCTSFDTPIHKDNSDNLADFINSLPEGKIVAVAVKGDAVDTPLTDKAKAACKSLGSAQIDQLQKYQAWALVGIKGHEPRTAQEQRDPAQASSSYSLDVKAFKQISSFTLEAISKPSVMGADYSLTGGETQIRLNGQTLSPDGGYKSGWNLIVLDRTAGQVKTSGSFNPRVPAEVDKFVETIQQLQPGEIVTIATQDYTGTQVPDHVTKACASIGATLVGKLTYGGNWAIVGYKGAKPGRAVESLDNFALYALKDYGAEGAKVKYWNTTTAPVKKELKATQKLWVKGASSAFATLQSVGIDGDYALVGDMEKSNAYVYHWQDGQWQLQQQLLPKEQSGNRFGFSVDVSSNLAIVGEPFASVSGIGYVGAAHIYELKDGQWHYQAFLHASDFKADASGFGVSVAIDGKVAIVGACNAAAPGKECCGAAYIFHLENGKWVQKAKLQPIDLGTRDYFGFSVSISGNFAIVGANHPDASGKHTASAAYIFHLENGKWVQQNKLQPLDLGSGFGSSVAIAGNWAIVGAFAVDVAGKTDAGVAYIYQLQDGHWQLHQKIQANDPADKTFFGYAVAIGGDVAIVGASNADGCGAAYLFELVNNKWEQTQKLQPEDLPASGFGYSASFDGRRAIIGTQGFAYICDVTIEQ
jgi:hypothetical protein